jgi:hypothetical protein
MLRQQRSRAIQFPRLQISSTRAKLLGEDGERGWRHELIPDGFSRGARIMSSSGTPIDVSFEKLLYRESLLPEAVGHHVAAYGSAGGLKSFSKDYLPGTPHHCGRKGMDVFLYEKGLQPRAEVLGYLHYPAEELKSGKWRVRIERWSTNGSIEPLTPWTSFSSEVEARHQRAFWCRRAEFGQEPFDRDSYKDNPEVPLGDVTSPKHFKELYQACIGFKRRRAPFLYGLCQLMDTAESSKEFLCLYSQIEEYKLLDKIGRGEKLAPEEELQLKTGRFTVAFSSGLTKARELAKKETQRRLEPLSLKLEEEFKRYISRGYIYLPRSVLTLRLNRKLGTNLSQDRVERWLGRFVLSSTLKPGGFNHHFGPYLLSLGFDAVDLPFISNWRSTFG